MTGMLSNVERNPGTPLNTDWIERVRVNPNAVERRTGTLAARRTVKKEYQAAWLVRAIQCIDLTMVAPAVRALEGSGIPVASVATGFPAGLAPLPVRLAEIRYATGEGAQEI